MTLAGKRENTCPFVDTFGIGKTRTAGWVKKHINIQLWPFRRGNDEITTIKRRKKKSINVHGVVYLKFARIMYV